MITAEIDVVLCKYCGLSHLVYTWLPWRVEGYCSKACKDAKGEKE